jgi:predicted DNA-binding transcriptional regulator AlpA
MTYPLEFREKVLLTQEREKLRVEEVAERVGIGKARVFRWSTRIEAPRPRNKPGTKMERARRGAI